MPALPQTIDKETCDRLERLIERAYTGYFKIPQTFPSDKLYIQESVVRDHYFVKYRVQYGRTKIVLETNGTTKNWTYQRSAWIISFAIALNHMRLQRAPLTSYLHQPPR